MISCCAKCFFVIALLIFVAASIVTWAVVPKLLKNVIGDELVLSKDKALYAAWELGSYPTTKKVYFFRVKNADRIQDGEQPELEEIGPYVFESVKSKKNVTPDGNRWKYSEESYHAFNATVSGIRKLDDPISVLNAPLIAILTWAERNSPTLLSAIAQNLNTIFPAGENLILQTTAKKILYDGIEVCRNNQPANVCDYVTNENFKMVKEVGGIKKFSFFHELWPMFVESFSVESGKEDFGKTGELKEWNGNSKMDKWLQTNEGSCNDVKGTDGYIFPGFVEKSREIEVFKSNLCKTFTFYYKRKLSGAGKYYEFATKSNAFPDSSEGNKRYSCYCLRQTQGTDDGCLKMGAVDMNSCLGSNVVASPPHFFRSDPVYQSGVKGLNARGDLHESRIVLDELFGFLQSSGFKTQYNMFMRRFADVPITSNLNATLFPLFWIDESVSTAADLTKLLDEFYLYYNYYELGALVVICVSGGLALLLLLCIVCLACRSRSKRRRREEERARAQEPPPQMQVQAHVIGYSAGPRPSYDPYAYERPARPGGPPVYPKPQRGPYLNRYDDDDDGPYGPPQKRSYDRPQNDRW